MTRCTLCAPPGKGGWRPPCLFRGYHLMRRSTGACWLCATRHGHYNVYIPALFGFVTPQHDDKLS